MDTHTGEFLIAEPDHDAARADFEHVWQAYSAHVIEYARRRLGNHPRRDADEEDIALSAMGSFYRGLAEQRFDVGEDDGDLWNLLCVIIRRKVSKRLRYHYAEKRGGGAIRGDSVFDGAADGRTRRQRRDQFPDPSPESPEAVFAQCSELFELLEEDSLQQIAAMKLEGYTNEEIADALDCGLRSVERKLFRIRLKWRPLAE